MSDTNKLNAGLLLWSGHTLYSKSENDTSVPHKHVLSIDPTHTVMCFRVLQQGNMIQYLPHTSRAYLSVELCMCNLWMLMGQNSFPSGPSEVGLGGCQILFIIFLML